MSRILLILAALALSFGNAVADNRPASAFSGYGSPEYGFCVKADVRNAARCAADACLKRGGNAVECTEMRTCPYAGWSLAVSLATKDGYRWHEFHCGFRSQASALVVFRILCREARMRTLGGCRLALLANPQGTLMPLK